MANDFQGTEVTLPIGIEHNGQLYKTVYIDRKRGTDNSNIDRPEYKDNEFMIQTALLQRAILEIPGVVPRKRDSSDLIPIEIVRNMTQHDRDACIVGMIKAKGTNPKIKVFMRCQNHMYGYELAPIEVRVDDINFIENNSSVDGNMIPFTLEEGLRRREATFSGEMETKVYKTGKMHVLRGAHMESIGALQNMGDATNRLLYRCVKFDDMVAPLIEKDIASLCDEDQAKLMLLQDKVPHYDLFVRSTCPICGSKVKGRISLVNFFGVKEEQEEEI